MDSSPLSDAKSPPSVRRAGLIRFALGVAVFAVGMLIPMYVLPYVGMQLSPAGMIPFALPGAYALVGLVEVMTGVPFRNLARRWDDLQGWQRGVFGTFIVVIAMVAIIVVVGLVASQF